MDVYKEWLGIPPGPRPPDHYELLRCVRFEDDTEKIKTFYRKLNAHVRKYATGQYSAQSQELLNEMAKAMLCLTDPERKREYDEHMGREFEARRDEFGRQPLLEVLVKQGKLSRDQKREVEDYCKRTGLAERDAVVQMKLATPEQAAQALSVQLALSYVDLDDMLPEDSILGLAPLPLVKKHSFLPLFIDDGRLLIACVDQPDHGLEEELQLRYGVPARAVIATPRSISQAITKYSSLIGVDEGKAGAAAGAKAKPAGKSAPAKKQKTASADGERTPFSQLSEGEKLQRKQYGILIMCWGFIVPMLIDQFLLWDRIWRFVPVLEISRWISPLAFTIGPATVWWVLKRYWK